MTADADLRALAERVKRSTRNIDILDLCDALLARLGAPQINGKAGPQRDRAAYMRDWRARKSENAQNRT